MALTDKQQAFVNEYLKCWNATQAAKRAGYSERTASAIGAENLTKPEVSAAIEQRKAELTMSADEVLVRLTEQARAAYSDYLTPDGAVNLESLLADGKGHLIKKIKPTKDGLEVEFYDAQAALVHLAKKHGLLTEKTELNGKVITENVSKPDLSKLSVEELLVWRELAMKAAGDDK